MLDIHTHILPGMDDGSKSLEQSLSMLKTEWKQGVSTVVMTPHYLANRETPEAFLNRRTSAEQLLSSLPEREMPRCLLGAEVTWFDGLSHCDAIEQLCIGETNAMLIEMPFCKWSRRMLSELQQLRQMRGIQPVLAHVERYLAEQPRDIIKQLVEQGMLIQVNASFFLRWQTSRKAITMLRQGNIHFVASDCHNLKQRPPNIGEAIDRISQRLGDQGIEMLNENTRKLFGGMK